MTQQDSEFAIAGAETSPDLIVWRVRDQPAGTVVDATVREPVYMVFGDWNPQLIAGFLGVLLTAAEMKKGRPVAPRSQP